MHGEQRAHSWYWRQRPGESGSRSSAGEARGLFQSSACWRDRINTGNTLCTRPQGNRKGLKLIVFKMLTFLFLNQTLWCYHSLESSRRDDFNEGHIIGFGWEMRKLSWKPFCSVFLNCSPAPRQYDYRKLDYLNRIVKKRSIVNHMFVQSLHCLRLVYSRNGTACIVDYILLNYIDLICLKSDALKTGSDYVQKHISLA